MTTWYNVVNSLTNVPATFSAFGYVAHNYKGVASMGILSRKQSGVYAIVNKTNGKRYIGSSSDIQERWKRHVRLLDTGKHHSVHLQRAWDKYRKNCFDFIVLRYCSSDELIRQEQAFLDFYRPEYNVSPTAGRTAGVVRSEEYIEKQRKSQSGKVLSEETRRKISEGMKGKKNSLGTKRIHSQSTIEKIRSTLLGHFVSDETRKKIGNKNRGHRHTDEAREKIRSSLIGNTRASKKNE